ncbi:hypothetical protein KUH32_10390 [Thalassococcus sp. CAU 1522]|uniref:Uncharacterized protein n=1 Tax=Thalassococcus arenae TaxID=2851652 RepID=A0ABS6N864_9RHOB|nr:DUF5665 domain-containing protein [Thalassococcus arenae]MBV2360183.1 hypothetical protein [Thalassococcus arenae]
MRKPKTPEPVELDGIDQLAAELARLNNHRFVRIHNSTLRLVWFQFLRGLAFGLGTVIGASALVSVLALLLAQIEVVPILGGLATEVLREIETTR